MTYATRLDVRGWACFRERSSLSFGPRAYAITASTVGARDRSNWAGKSALASTVKFVLFGTRPANMGYTCDDDFITRGEKECEVAYEFSDGTVVSRTRKLGKATRLSFTPRGGKSATGDEAQTLVSTWLGLTEDDLYVTCLFEQARMARLVHAEKGERAEIVSGWLDLGKLERAADIVGKRATAVAADAAAWRVKLAQLSESDADDDELEAEVSGARVAVEQREAEVASARERLDAVREAVKSAAEAERYDRVVAEGKEVRSELEEAKRGAKADLPSLREKATGARVALSAAREEAKRLRVVARGQFDGACPVADIACPAKKQINADRAASSARHEAAEAARRAAEGVSLAASEEYEVAAERDAEVRRLEERLSTLRGVVAGMEKPASSRDDVPDEAGARAALREATERLSEARAALARAEARVEQAGRARKAAEEAGRQAARVESELVVLVEARRVFGRQGAQRVLAEAALSEIEGIANEVLSDSGIDLSVSARWSREGKGWASECDACGWPFPESVKIKECVKCAAPRGPKSVPGLEFVVSARSGAADDLAGAAMQLGAARWLRERRGSPWGLAVMDEPTAQMDAAHRRSWLSALPRSLSAAGFEQALVISHSPDVAEALPGKIRVVRDGDYSTASVEG